MQVVIYNFSKRNNSTKIPDIDGRTINCQLKENCSVLNPTFILSFDPSQYNYIYVPTWHRYYFITDWSYITTRWEITCEADLLASLKSTILSTPCNVLYATGSTKNIVDSRIPLLGSMEVSHNYKAIEGITISGVSNQGAIILGITGKGSFGSYLMQDSTAISQLLDGVDNFWTTSVQESEDAWKQIFYGGSASECLKSAIALPIVIGGSAVGSGTAQQLKLGGYPCQTSGGSPLMGYKITKPVLQSTTSVSIPWKYSDWRRNTPYSEVMLYLPFIGTISLPTADIINESSLSIKYAINVTSGDIAVSYAGASSSRIIGTASGNIAMATAYGSTGIDTNKMTSAVVTGVGAVVGGVASALSGGLSTPVALGVAGGLATATAGTIQALGGTASGSGGLGGGASQGLDPVIHCYVISRALSDSQDKFTSIMGKPYMGVSTPSQFNGFIMTEGFSINAGISSTEKDTINKLMDSGVYIE